jgi:hypothetical protein
MYYRKIQRESVCVCDGFQFYLLYAACLLADWCVSKRMNERIYYKCFFFFNFYLTHLQHSDGTKLMKLKGLNYEVNAHTQRAVLILNCQSKLYKLFALPCSIHHSQLCCFITIATVANVRTLFETK